ncbi:MAG: type II toxin-antitoxin system VapC family toxin [Acidobacteriota bacterium]
MLYAKVKRQDRISYIIVDTDILIDASHDVQLSLDCLRRLEQQATLAISVVTEMELIVGCRNKMELRVIELLIGRFHLLGISEPISYRASQLLKQYRLSHGLLILDAIIAATAMETNEPLISKNQRDFRYIANLNLLPYP